MKSVYYKIRNYVIDIKISIRQFFEKIFLGHTREEIWNTDKTISKFVYERLTLFIETKRWGHPDLQVPEEYGEMKSDEYWEIVLRKMKDSFYLLSVGEYEGYSTAEMEDIRHKKI